MIFGRKKLKWNDINWLQAGKKLYGNGHAYTSCHFDDGLVMHGVTTQWENRQPWFPENIFIVFVHIIFLQKYDIIVINMSVDKRCLRIITVT